MKNPLRFLRRMSTNKSGQTSSVPVEKPIGNPKSYTMEILLEAIHQGHVSIEKYGFLPGFRARICELRKYGVPFVPITISEINKYGRPYKLTRHSLPTEDQKKAAVRIYNRVNSELK